MTTRDMLIELVQETIKRMLGTSPKKNEIRVVDFYHWDGFPNNPKNKMPEEVVFTYGYMRFKYQRERTVETLHIIRLYDDNRYSGIK